MLNREYDLDVEHPTFKVRAIYAIPTPLRNIILSEIEATNDGQDSKGNFENPSSEPTTSKQSYKHFSSCNAMPVARVQSVLARTGGLQHRAS
jgi:hypothetical protein